MRAGWQAWWRVCKVVLTLAVLGCVGWQFAQVLRSPEVWRSVLHLRPGWSLAAGALYLLGLACSALFWHGLLRALGQHATGWAVLRAYYIGQLGRYVPGKVVGVLFRAELLRGPGVSRTTAILTIIYESLTTLSAGALLATVVLALRGADTAGLRWRALGLVVLLGIPLLPPVYNRVIRRVAARFPETQSGPLPGLKRSTLAAGLAVTGCGWGLQGASLWALLQALLPQPQPWSWEAWANDTGFVALATVIGFLVVAVPGGLGVRELILQQFLAADLAALLGEEQALALSVVAVLLLRLVWTTADVVAAGFFSLLPAHAGGTPLPCRGLAAGEAVLHRE
jgi:glycosyltransferase 2 family protein